MIDYLAEIDNDEISFQAEPNSYITNSNKILFEDSPASIRSLKWAQEFGYTSLEVFNNTEHNFLRNIIKNHLNNIFIELKIATPEVWHLEDYHKIIKDDVLHEKIISITREFDPKDFNVASRICNSLNDKYNLKFSDNASVIKEYGHELLIIRINRPNSRDINPPHRDGDLKKWKNCINMWYSLSGDSELSTLPLIPNSHFYREKDISKLLPNALFEGKKYTVNAIVGTSHGFKFIRPKLSRGSVLIFTPFLIHGIGYNYGNTTRMSFELRPMVV